jgi:hypothetical protein
MMNFFLCGRHVRKMQAIDACFLPNFYLQVLVCTATLAWGVNLPAHMVVIKVSFFSTFCYQDTVSNCGLCTLPDDGSPWMHCVLIASLIQFPYWVQWTLIIASVLFLWPCSNAT